MFERPRARMAGASGLALKRRFGLVAGAAILLVLLVAGCQRASAGSATTAAQPGQATSLAVEPTDGALLMAARGIFRSTNRGQTWEPLPLPSSIQPENIVHIAGTARAPAVLHAGGPGAGIIRSDDGGRSWRSISEGLPSQEVAAFAVHSLRPDTAYAFLGGQGVFQTENAGGRWQRMDDGPPGPPGPPLLVRSLAHSPLEGSMNTGWLYAGTSEAPYLSMDCF